MREVRVGRISELGGKLRVSARQAGVLPHRVDGIVHGRDGNVVVLADRVLGLRLSPVPAAHGAHGRRNEALIAPDDFGGRLHHGQPRSPALTLRHDGLRRRILRRGIRTAHAAHTSLHGARQSPDTPPRALQE